MPIDCYYRFGSSDMVAGAKLILGDGRKPDFPKCMEEC